MPEDEVTAAAPAPNKKELMATVFGEDFTDDSDDAVLPTRPHRRAAESDSDDDDDDDDDSAPTPGKPAASRPSAGPAETPGRRKGRLSRRRGGAGDDDEDDDQGDSGDDEVRPAARRARSSRRAGGGGGVAAPRRKSALDDMDDDDFIDDAGAARRRRRGGEDDDVVRTEGGWHVDAEDMEVRPGEEEAELDDEDRRPKTAFEEAEARLKANRRQRKKEADPVEVDAEVVEFLSQMMAAHVEDVEAYSEGRPALAKLRMLPAVRLMFVRHEYRESLLNNMVLAVLKCWLEPMSDSALPNIEIRTVLLDILGTFRVDTGWVGLLENSQGLGKIIHYLSIKDDHPPNQLAAKKLLKAWARPFYNANDDFHDLRKDYELGQGVAEIRRDARRSLSKLEARNARRLDLLRSSVGREEGEEQVKVMASIPEKTPFLFTKMADSEVQERVTKNRGAKRKQAGGSSGIARRFNSLKKARKTGAARGAANPSINGR